MFSSIQRVGRSLVSPLTLSKTRLQRLPSVLQLRNETVAALHSNIERNPSFSRITDEDVSYFASIIGESGVVTDVDELEAFNEDWMGNWKGSSQLALKPKTTEQVSKILAYCNERKLAVVPQGGNTGLVGGSIPIYDEVVLSMGRMNNVISLDEYGGIVTAEAGIVLEQLNSYLEEKGFIMPLDLGAKGSCQIGGNAATNAGGIRYLRYGSLHGNILGLEAVLPDGTILDTLSTMRKDNTGYDLKQLFIGSEGTLGVITKLALLCPRKPTSTQVAYLGLDSYEDVLKLMVRARTELVDIISAIEFQDRGTLELAVRHLPGARDPLETSCKFYVLIETSGSNADHDNEKLNAFLERTMEDGLILDGTVAQDESRAKDLWMLREGIAEALVKEGKVYKYDLSVPVTEMYNMVDVLQERLGDRATVLGYGHLGDANLHLNVSVPKHSDEVFNLIEPFVFERVAELKGSVSAEHGVGQCKVDYLHLSKNDTAISVMKSIKNLFDPNGIMNPYKVLKSDH